MWHEVSSLVTEQYWSDAPIRLGPLKQAVKYTVKPCPGQKPTKAHSKTAADLKSDLAQYAATQPICFDFFVQFQLDVEKQSIEDALVEWKEEDTPLIPVAKVVFEPPQQPDLSDRCKQLRFTPWHALAQHQPLGNMNRAKKFVYAKSQVLRHAAKTVDDKTPFSEPAYLQED
jgi:hypothetical protein